MSFLKAKRLLGLLTATVLALSLLAGCGDEPDTASSDASASGGDVSTSSSANSGDSTTTGSTTSATTDKGTAGDKQPSSTKKPVGDNTTTTTKSTSSSRKTIATKSRDHSSKIDLSMFPVKPKLTIEQAAPKVNNNLSASATKIASVKAQVDDYNKDWAFVHQQGLAVFKGKLYAAYSRGKADEDAPGQRVEVASMSLSSFGKWSEPVVAAKTRKLGAYETCNLCGFMVSTKDKLFLYFMEKVYGADAYDNQGNYKNYQENAAATTTGMVTWTTDGVNWSTPEPIGLAGNESPRQLLSGQWMAGSGSALLFCEDKELDGFGLYKLGMTDAQYRNSVKRGNLRMLTESSWYQTDDYIIHQMLRSGDGFLWMSESYDNGKSWTEAYKTNFAIDDSMANFGRLPDGRYYCVGSHTTQAGISRFPLTLWVSKDGYNFDKAYILRDEKYTMNKYGWAKDGQYAYPEVLIHDGYMYIHYSRQKEISEVTRVKLTDIK